MNNLIRLFKLTVVGFIFLLIPLFIYASINARAYSHPMVIQEDDVLREVNYWRTIHGFDELIVDENLCDFAQLRLSQTKENFSHNDFHDEARHFVEYFDKEVMGENLYQGANTNPEEILQMWLDSPTHKTNITRNFTHTCMECEDGTCVNLFLK